MKLALNIAGILAVLLGLVGAFVPLLPTTPFLLLAAACFARGSPRMHKWLLTNPWFGKFLSDYEQGRGIPARAKALALLMMWASLALVMLRYDLLLLRLLLAAIGCGVSVYLLRLPTRRP
ncbi:MAG: YbaN family protein [Pseudomonadota bacterium]